MAKQRDRIRLRVAAVTAALTGLIMLLPPGHSGALTHARTPSPASAAVPAIAECEGDACTQVALTFDEAKQQYRARNNSSDRWVKVSASNLASSASACLAPGKEQYLTLKSVVGGYQADYAEVKCGETMDE